MSHHSSPSTKKFKTIISVKKIMASVFWDHKGIILIEYLPQGRTIKAAKYSETLKKLRRDIQNKRKSLLTRGVCLLHDNARPTQPMSWSNFWAHLDGMFWTTLRIPRPGAFRLPFGHFPEEAHRWEKIFYWRGCEGVVEKWTKEVAANSIDIFHEKNSCDHSFQRTEVVMVFL